MTQTVDVSRSDSLHSFSLAVFFSLSLFTECELPLLMVLVFPPRVSTLPQQPVSHMQQVKINTRQPLVRFLFSLCARRKEGETLLVMVVVVGEGGDSGD